MADDANIVDYFCFILRTGLGLMEANRAFLNSHQCYFRKFWPELEIEHKLTISSQIDIYGLAVHFRNLIGHDKFSNYIWEYRDDFQQWDFVNFVYEIQAPEDEAGYVAFIPDSLGKVVVKRKWFASDSVHRRETKWLGVVVDGDYGAYIAQRFGVNGSLVGGFRRTRFDITLEALATGNVHSIMIDRCRFMNNVYHDLSQIEIEYLHSRSLRPSASDAVEDELDEIVALTESVLRELHIDYVKSPMSKLTYMKKMAELGARDS